MGIKVLYIEDELFLAKIVKESLESRGFEVLLESDGAKAVSLFKNELPDVCVLDIMLPNTDGFAIAEGIRKINTDHELSMVRLGSAKVGFHSVR